MSGQKCCHEKFSGWGYAPTKCSANAKVERDGRWYCLRHDPVARKAKADAKMAAWRAERQAEYDRAQKAAAEAAEQRRRAECYDDLVAALVECADDLEAEIKARADCELPRRIERDLATVQRARAAIAKATGGGQ